MWNAVQKRKNAGFELGVSVLLLTVVPGCGTPRECRESFITSLSFASPKTCPTNSDEVMRVMAERYGWSEPYREDEEDSADFLERSSSAALTVCWYGRSAGTAYCSEGRRDRDLERARSCEDPHGYNSTIFARRESISLCDGDTQLHGDLFVMSDPDVPLDCPAESALAPDSLYVGRDIYPPCDTCVYSVTTTWTCRTTEIGSVPNGL